ncbi:hypothetical protein BCON_0119g00100 [Botryotinia convoluta]|uniref:Uncharacterized protein n=1 Tax=Botryotinia convoluta TaxID=54673 RepID=A0A4Z1HX95_9HELO|nr:hypothetical protein BCON_0119g00100 [Botryotinia convoluta]
MAKAYAYDRRACKSRPIILSVGDFSQSLKSTDMKISKKLLEVDTNRGTIAVPYSTLEKETSKCRLLPIVAND